MSDAERKEEGSLLNKDLGVVLSPNFDNIKEVIYIYIYMYTYY